MVFGNKPSWYRQKALKNKYKDTEVPGIGELDNLLYSVRFGKLNSDKQTLQARALFVLYYLTACRCSEIIKTSSLKKRKRVKRGMAFYPNDDEYYDKITTNNLGEKTYYWTIKEEFEGIKLEDVKFETINGKEALLIRTLNRKNKGRTTKRQPIPISLEEPLVNHLMAYINTLQVEECLFPFGTKRATQIINEVFDFNIHFIRHIRATHLITLYDFNEQALIDFMGWTDARPAKHYMELSKKDLFNQFYKNQRLGQ